VLLPCDAALRRRGGRRAATAGGDEPEHREQNNCEQANLVSVGIAAQDPHIDLLLEI